MYMNLKAELVKKTSKAGLPYICIELTFPNNYKKLVFLNQAELALLNTSSKD